METMQQTIDRLQAIGCRGRIEGERFIVSGIPDWRTRREVEDLLPDLALIALAKQMLGGPVGKPMRPIPESEGNRCNHCLHFQQYHCDGRPNLSPAMMRDGCGRYSYTPIYL
jgi:hypothetical protein